MPILGIIASQNYSRFTDTGAMFPIAMVNVGSAGASTIEFTSIPQTYKHLQVRGIARTNRAATTDFAKLRFNSDSTTNYSIHGLEADGSAAAAYGVASQDNINIYRFGSATATASVFGVSVIDILDYTSTNKYKTVRSLGGADNNGSGVLGLVSGAWLSTSAITSIQIIPGIGTSFNQYTQFALYGIK
jgi:hypothetical protein